MKNIETVANAVMVMDKHLREELLIKDGAVQHKKLWENTYIKKQIDKRESGGIFTVSDHTRAMVYSMLTSGTSWSRVETGIDVETGRILHIDEIFSQYDVDTLLNTDPMELVDRVISQTLGTPYIKKQMQALIRVNIGKFLSLKNEYGSVDNFYQGFIEGDATMKTLVKELSAEGRPHKFAQMGEALIAEYLRNVGYDLSKPDRHIRRILGCKIFGCSDKETVPVYEAFDIVAEIARYMGRPVAEVDYILWMYCATGYGEVCTVRRPKCDVCTVRDICKNINL